MKHTGAQLEQLETLALCGRLGASGRRLALSLLAIADTFMPAQVPSLVRRGPGGGHCALGQLSSRLFQPTVLEPSR